MLHGLPTLESRGSIPLWSTTTVNAPVAKLEDAPDLDSGGRLVDARPVRVQVPSGAPQLT